MLLLFSQVSSSSYLGQVKIQTSTGFVIKPVKIWNGTDWVKKPARFWNGSEWVFTLRTGTGGNSTSVNSITTETNDILTLEDSTPMDQETA